MITFAIALATSFTATVPVRQLALHLGMLDRPGPRKVHNTPMPLLGGLGIYCGAVLAIVLSMDGQPRGQIFSILAAATLLLIVGTLDDRGLLHHQVEGIVVDEHRVLYLTVDNNERVSTRFASARPPLLRFFPVN